MSAEQASQEIQFTDIAKLTDHEIQLTLRDVYSDAIAVAFLQASEDVKARIFSNISERAGTMIKKMMESRTDAEMSQIEEARARVVEVMQQLIQEGQVVDPSP